MSIYKECDIRGIYAEEFDEKEAYLIGKAIGSMHQGEVLALGGDVRLSTPVLKAEIKRGILDVGVDIVDIGTVPTPAFYYALNALEVDGGIQVTASHNPAKYNGFKFMFHNIPATFEMIQEIERRVVENDFVSGDSKGSIAVHDINEEYRTWMTGQFGQIHKKVVVDCCNGAMSEDAPAVFKALGFEVVELYCTFDGSFPNRDPNPAVYSHLTDLCKKVTETGADFGAAFDGDGDRMVFVDDKGNAVMSERSLVLFINEYLKEVPSSVVYDLKSSSVVKNAIVANGGEPRMERSGHAFIKKNFLENGSALAGEISGHFFFGELGYDDGLYAALKMGEILDKNEKSMSEMLADIPQTIITPDLRAFCPYAQRDSWLDKVRSLSDKYEVTELDGVRVQFDDGWLLLRKSVTEEGVTLRIEADDEEGLENIKNVIRIILPELSDKVF